MPTDTDIIAKVKARRAADVLHALAMEEAVEHTGEAALEFWKRLMDNVCAVLPSSCLPVREIEVGSLAAMSNDESKEFEQTMIEFGKHAGTRIKDIPLDYLCWLDEQPDFRAQLNRYLRSDRIRQEQENNET